MDSLIILLIVVENKKDSGDLGSILSSYFYLFFDCDFDIDEKLFFVENYLTGAVVSYYSSRTIASASVSALSLVWRLIGYDSAESAFYW